MGQERYDAVVFNNPRSAEGWRQETGNLIEDVLENALYVLSPNGQVRFSSTDGMPGTLRLKALIKPGSLPPGYSRAGRSLYYSDVDFGVPYRPENNTGDPLGLDPLKWYWYIFEK